MRHLFKAPFRSTVDERAPVLDALCRGLRFVRCTPQSLR